MLKSLIKRLTAGEEIKKEEEVAWDLKEATAAVLYSVIEVDHSVEHSELERMYTILASAFGLGQEDIGHLFEMAQKLYGNHDAFEKLLGLMREKYTIEQRKSVYDMIWQIIKADGRIDRHEVALAELLEGKLGLKKT